MHFLDVDPGIARFDLMLELIEADERLGGWLEYSTDLFEAATMARMAAHLQTLLEAIVANPEERISRLPLLPAGERRRVLIDWNDTKTSFRRLGTFSERFAKQAERTPDAIGGVRQGGFGSATASSRVGARPSPTGSLMEGVGPDVVVVLLAERGVDFLAAMIAVQRAGGAFLPLDPTIPAGKAGPDHSAQPHTACARRARLRHGA